MEIVLVACLVVPDVRLVDAVPVRVLIAPLELLAADLRVDWGIAITLEETPDDLRPMVDPAVRTLAVLLFDGEVLWITRPALCLWLLLWRLGDLTTMRDADDRRVVRLAEGFDERELDLVVEVRLLLLEPARELLLSLLRELLLEEVEADAPLRELDELVRREGLVARLLFELRDREADRLGLDDDRRLVVLREEADDDEDRDDREEVVLLLDDFLAGFLPASATDPKMSTITQASETSPVIRVILIVAPPFAAKCLSVSAIR